MLVALAAFQTGSYAQSRRTAPSSSSAGQTSSSRRTSSSDGSASRQVTSSSVSRNTSGQDSRGTSSAPARRTPPASDRTTSTGRRVSSASAQGGTSSGRTPSASSSTSSRRVTPVTSGTSTPVRTGSAAPRSDRNVPSSSVAGQQSANRHGSSDNRPSGSRQDNVQPAARPESYGRPPRSDDHGKPQPPRDDFRPQHPRDRDYIDFDRRPPHHFYDPHHDHCFGYRVRALPAGYWYRDWHGVRYYCHDDIYYRLVDGCYVVCRPPFGTVIAAAAASDIVWTALRMSYYNTMNSAYRQVNFDNAHQLALAMGLVQSYAEAGTDCFCQDGVFYRNINGQFYVIVPPAGALVESLPEDYDTFIFNGREYYQVDSTVYRVTVVAGRAYFEVLGQR